jgi:hypothetical protein
MKKARFINTFLFEKWPPSKHYFSIFTYTENIASGVSEVKH